MEILRDLLYTNRGILKDTFKSAKKNWPIIFMGLFYSIATIFLYSILQYFWILAGIILIIATSALISNYLYLLNCIVTRNKISFQDFKDGFTAYLRKVWGILFVFWVASLAFDLVVAPLLMFTLSPTALRLMISFLLFILLNSLPEVIYQKHYNPWETITYSMAFVRDNWLEWFIPNSILFLVLFFFTGNLITSITRYSLLNIFLNSQGILLYILGQIWLAFAMIYRGYLFDLLSTSNRRKRLFMRKF
ncbi:hypothetical protein [Alkaliphilus peptidifermentans]|uniref:DUF4013 domain-containing protein n=1 Tax=Alkaliphilus peptidifermentans DSM 18978 TaxID=1120976 RepID=A0A1G5KBQ3_9FIRM|nr:hypothetical protein [Alkaliphilus peptidifermentans]SCY97488.1 hypothetical protein SAMN03080606_03359 [Alkaliphilus peptidifermentans DSM 18978]